MKLYSLLVYDKNKHLVYSKHDLTDIPFMYRFMTRGTIENIAAESLQYIEHNNLYMINETIEDKKIVIYGHCAENIVIIITDPEYPQYLVRQIFMNFRSNNVKLDELWNKFSDGKNADKIQQIKTELDETKVILLNSIDELLERGEKISTLVDKTNQLNQDSFSFAKRAKKMNRCCVII